MDRRRYQSAKQQHGYCIAERKEAAGTLHTTTVNLMQPRQKKENG